MKKVVASLSFVVLAAGMSLAQDDASKADLKKFAGMWKFAEVQHPDPNFATAFKEKGEIEFTDENLKANIDGNELKATLKLDASKKPRHIDLKTDNDKTILGIYELKDGKIWMCVGDHGGDRPTSFTPDLNAKQMFVILEKKK